MGSVLLLVALSLLWVKLKGIRVEATPAAFAAAAGAPRLEERQSAMRLVLPVPRSGGPAELGWIRVAARYGIPVDVAVPLGGRSLGFTVAGLSPDGDLLVPCASRTDCADILVAVGLALPSDLAGTR